VIFVIFVDFVKGAVARDGDGWGEVLFVHAGYESRWLSLERYSAQGFAKEVPEFAHGC
jgi:hypothetical protein